MKTSSNQLARPQSQKSGISAHQLVTVPTSSTVESPSEFQPDAARIGAVVEDLQPSKIETDERIQDEEVKFCGLLPAMHMGTSETHIRALKNGEMLLTIQDLTKMVTSSFALGMDGRASATSREGQASVLQIVRCNDGIIALPFAMYIAFECSPSSGWAWEIPVALGKIGKKRISISTDWISELPWTELPLRIHIESNVIDKLDNSEVIAPDGENFGPNVPLKEYFDRSRAFSSNAAAASKKPARSTAKRLTKARSK